MIILISIAMFLFGCFADVYTTAQNNDGIGGMKELNKKYQLPNGDADIRKLAMDKVYWFIGLMILSLALYFSGLDFTPAPSSISFAGFFAFGILTAFVGYKNYKLGNKFRSEK